MAPRSPSAWFALSGPGGPPGRTLVIFPPVAALPHCFGASTVTLGSWVPDVVCDIAARR